MILQTHVAQNPSLGDKPWARFYPHGMLSGSAQEDFDSTVFWPFNRALLRRALLRRDTRPRRFTELKIVSRDPHPFVIRARSPNPAQGIPPNQTQSPWC